MYVQVRQTGRYAGINILHKTDKTEAIYVRGLAWMGTDVHQLRSKPRKCLRNDKAFPQPPQQRHTSKQTHSLIDSLRQLKLKAATKRATKQRSKRTMAARTRTTPGESPRQATKAKLSRTPGVRRCALMTMMTPIMGHFASLTATNLYPSRFKGS